MTRKRFDKSMFKMTPEQLSNWEACQKRTSVVPGRKGSKGIQKRKDNKLRNDIKNQMEDR